jgi:hypothetical protein
MWCVLSGREEVDHGTTSEPYHFGLAGVESTAIVTADGAGFGRMETKIADAHGVFFETPRSH